MTRTFRWTRRLVAAGLLLVPALFLLSPSRPAPGSGDSSSGGDPFPAAGADATAAPRILLPTVHSLSDAVETPGGWIVLDRRGDRIHALERDGRLRWSAGGEGRGPGELLRPVALTVTGTTVVVADARGSTLDRFDLSGRFVERTALRATDCMGNLVRDLAPWEDGAVVLLRVCLEPGSGAMRIRADRIGTDGSATPLASLPLKSLRRPGDDLLATGVMATREGTLYLGVTTSRCVRAYRGTGSAAGAVVPLAPVCLPEAAAVPLPDEERRKLDRALGRRPLARALGLASPATLPPFDALFAADSTLVFRTLTSLEGRSLVGVPVGSPGRSGVAIPVPATEHTFLGSRSVLVSWQEVEGTALRVVHLSSLPRAPHPGLGPVR